MYWNIPDHLLKKSQSISSKSEITQDCHDHLIQHCFLTIVRPYKGTSSDTIAHQIKNTMQEPGINAGLFSPHSFRSAATSKAEASGTSITTILQSASWSRTSTFKRVYLNDIQQVYPNPNNEEVVYIRAI